ncbi:DNA-binding transcriptional regulator, GntR family [Treponema bryantii]|uniref:DNA-binding transcriptional regulator, GntR family n=1 Tax=Treponema bryantii TaxID=163 RepID=A0A1H8ZPL7_9SPIR|nr:GntR family transcriptional regulator [Treponema bryantii]BDC93942.1 GntR family transcriptional regulator [Treponema bryantii]SEP66459.1 DNA-binding transcriptional regulator, GntR family [Treponema bryantii]
MKNTEKHEKETNREYALRVIKDNIVNLELAPGSMISEQDIANELNLSRTPVHEAMQELSSTKIIEILPQRGSHVSLIDMAHVDEAVFARTTIESEITMMACQQASEKDIQEMEENVTLQRFYYEKHNLDKIMELDNAFHEIMYKITNKMQCHYMVRLMSIHLDRIRELTIQAFNPERIIKEHEELLETFKKKDPAAAKEVLNKHLSRKHFQEDELRKAFPQYFA